MSQNTLTLENGITAVLLHDSVSKNEIPDHNIADVWIINHEKPWIVKQFLQSIIKHPDPHVYLKPVFLQKNLKIAYKKKKKYNLRHLCDGYIDHLHLDDRVASVEFILHFIKNLQKTEGLHSNEILQKTLWYYYSRNKKIEFHESSDSLNGYPYPRIESYFSGQKESYLSTKEMLTNAYKSGFLNRNYADTSHLCHKCSSGFLNYREECPKCGSHNLQVRSLIHHFRCAYVASEDHFQKGERMICPKCNTELKNLGVDYDRPSKIFFCKKQDCRHEFQKPLIGVHCISCKTEQAPSELKVEKIYKYEITQKAINEIIMPHSIG
ncbi:hypothetical protein [Chryseobacterium sp. NKUCC03_KSP]|uniref:TackOD1 domain-containing metal-binding protein n=1 Tax=Chryseobacterium sp. NKUCC03_KSP TaxID=2842125 RepID=UPI001C5AE217|nr:hypothetical protein [Chryseobacterium sp. NKUCC03_KSP]MBW3524175.1 hypothetical protein [Chryseobacterium sp. NKUCC03_KSP]